jgi:prepilin-type N-terminal cleavage/methylation domain-containing protein
MKDNKINMKNNYTGFTLAEVLITLLIIGVVSSLVIPAIINDTQEAELKTAWKKTYSEIDQATKKIMLDNAGTMKDLSFSGDSSNFIKDKYGEYLSYIESCNNNRSYGNCWSTINTYKNGSTSPYSTPEEFALHIIANDAGAILKNGTFIQFHGGTVGSYKSDCPENMCSNIFVDVNGFKNPNVVGKDIFGIIVTPTGIKPYGSYGYWNQNTCSDSSTGWSCSAQYLYQ